MGTNFYLKGYRFDFEAAEYIADDSSGERDDNPRIHIGKRSAAGPYCWDCGMTFCRGGNERIHTSSDEEWASSCPSCGAAQQEIDSIAEAAAVAVELGFAEPNTERPKGVGSCSSFIWAQPPKHLMDFLKQNQDEVVVDEYGRTMTGESFLTMLKMNCPIEYKKIGEWFS